MTAPRFTPGETWRLVEEPKWPFRLRIESSNGREVLQAGRSCYSTRHKTLDDLRNMDQWGDDRDEALAANARQLADLRMCAASPALYAALEALHDWRGLCDDNANATFERIGDAFYLDTGYLRPGKSAPMDSFHSREREQEREKAWRDWVKRKNDELDAQIRAALAAARGGQ